MYFKIYSFSLDVSSLNFYVKLFYFKAFFSVVSLDIRSLPALYQNLEKKKENRGRVYSKAPSHDERDFINFVSQIKR